MSVYSGSKPKFLDQLVAGEKLTASGRDWLTLALDPFHDLSHQAAGYPDADSSQTIVSCYQYQTDITAPSGVTTNWDAHVYTMPVLDAMPYSLSTSALAMDEVITENAATPTKCSQGPLNIITGASGARLVPSSTVTLTNTTLPLYGDTSLSSGCTRLIGVGYEVTNTTAKISKQGAVTSYRMPQTLSRVGSTCVYNSAATQIVEAASITMHMPPATVADANLLKGTRTWDASDGVYAVAMQNSSENPLAVGSSLMALETATAYSAVVHDIAFSQYTTVHSNAAPLLSSSYNWSNHFTPFDTTGSIFTGLSPATTLTVKVKFYVERAPGFYNPSLSVLATPSAGLDLTALELYSKAISELPVAVTVAENGLGDWFRGLVSVLKNVAGGVASVFLGPMGTRIGNAANSVQQFAGQMDSFKIPKRSLSISQPELAERSLVLRQNRPNSISSRVKALKKKKKESRSMAMPLRR